MSLGVTDKRVILIEIQAKMNNLTTEFNRTYNSINKSIARIKGKMSSINSEYSISSLKLSKSLTKVRGDIADALTADKGTLFFSEGEVLKKTDFLKRLRQYAREISVEQRELTDKYKEDMIPYKKKLSAKNKELEKLKRNYKETLAPMQEHTNQLKKEIALDKTGKREFAGYALSIMFFGMAIQRIFTSIWKTSSKTFQDVMHSVEGTTTGFDMLEGSVKYLGFMAGQALEPVIQYLLPIIDYITDWIQQNEELFAGIVLVSGAIGTLAMAGGMLKLAYDGFATLGVILGGASSAAIPIAAIAASLIAIGAISWKAFNKTPDAWDDIKETFKELSPFVNSIKESFVNLIETVFPNLHLSWDTVAWFFAMGFHNLIQLLKIALKGFENLLTIITTVIEHVKGLASAMRMFFEGDFSGAFSTAKTTLENDIDAMKSMVTEFAAVAEDSLSELYFDVNVFKGLHSAEGKKAMADFGTYTNVQRAFPISQLFSTDGSLSVDRNPGAIYNQVIIDRLDISGAIESGMSAVELMQYVIDSGVKST